MTTTKPQWMLDREAGKTCPRCAQARSEAAAHGLPLIRSFDHGDDFCQAQSVATVPGTFGHPRVSVVVRAAYATKGGAR